MIKIFKCIFAFSMIFLLATGLSSCKQNKTNNETQAVKIQNVTFSSLSEAVENAKENDTIKIYDDISDNKNIEIKKPLKILGVKNQNNIRPKFFGSFTIDMEHENDSVTIENLDIVHEGRIENSKQNNTLVGINIIDGGAVLSNNKISLQNEQNADTGASGVVVSRKINSVNTMPFSIKGNSFGNYKSSENFSGAILVKSNDPEKFEFLSLNNDLLFNQNSFSFAENGTQFLSIKFEETPPKINFLVTSSTEELIDKLQNNQSSENSTFILKNAKDIATKQEKSIPINQNTVVCIEGNNQTDFGSNTFEIFGTINLNSDTKNANFIKKSSTSSIIVGKDVETENLSIQ